MAAKWQSVRAEYRKDAGLANPPPERRADDRVPGAAVVDEADAQD